MSPALRPLETGWWPETPVDDTVLRRFLYNQIEVNEHIAAARGGRTRRTTDVSLVETGPVTAFLNQAVLLRPLIGTDDPVLGDIESYYRHECVLLSAWPTPDLSGRGWQMVGHPTFVLRAPGAVDEQVGDAVVGLVADLEEFERVVLDGYPMPPPADGRPTFAAPLVGSPVRLRIARLDDVAVASAASHIAHGVVNLCLAATLPAARRRGAWAALVRARVGDDPSLPAAAVTSDDSRPGFERMGFLPVTRFTFWSR